MIFKEDVVIEGEKILITVSCEKRKFSFEPKAVYEKKVITLLSAKMREEFIMVSSPLARISNIDNNDYITEGTWVFEKKTKQTPTKSEPDPNTEAPPATRRRTRRKKT